jgi:threonine dehydrogenase-like Zn-dependent dehydrogenase
MKAVIFEKELKFVDDYLVPEPAEGEALMRVSIAGICGTDLEIIEGYKGFKGVIGHEFVGRVERIKSGDKRLLGKRVVGEINIGCGLCKYCLEGLQNHCASRKAIGISGKDGAMAEYLALPVENLFEVPEGITDEEAVFIEPLASAFEILRQIQIRSDDRILVLGDGKLGLLIAFVLKISYTDVTLVGKHENKLKIAEKKMVKTLFLKNVDRKKEFDVVVDATGSAEGFKTAMGMVKPRGTIVLKSTFTEEQTLNLTGIVVDEITVVGSRCGPFETALNALTQKNVDVRPLITAVFPFDAAKEAFVEAMKRDSLKVLVAFTMP